MAIKKYQSAPAGEEYKSIMQKRRIFINQAKAQQLYPICANELKSFEENIVELILSRLY